MLKTLKKRQQFVDVKKYGQSWATESFIVQGLIYKTIHSQIDNTKIKKFLKSDDQVSSLNFCFSSSVDLINNPDLLTNDQSYNTNFSNLRNKSYKLDLSTIQFNLNEDIIEKNHRNRCLAKSNTYIAPIFIGYTATKRLGNAVQRNRAKRRLRELCRLNSHMFISEQIHYVLAARSKILTCTFEQLQQNLQWALKHLHRIMKVD